MMELGMKVQYKTVKGWSGKKYQVRMTEKEINARRVIGLVVGIVVGTPLWIAVMALAAGLI